MGEGRNGGRGERRKLATGGRGGVFDYCFDERNGSGLSGSDVIQLRALIGEKNN
jgi:hypothetical protein